MDVLQTNYILKQKKLHGNKVIAFATPMVREVDTKEDFKYIEFEVSQNQSLTSRLF